MHYRSQSNGLKFIGAPDARDPLIRAYRFPGGPSAPPPRGRHRGSRLIHSRIFAGTESDGRVSYPAGVADSSPRHPQPPREPSLTSPPFPPPSAFAPPSFLLSAMFMLIWLPCSTRFQPCRGNNRAPYTFVVNRRIEFRCDIMLSGCTDTWQPHLCVPGCNNINESINFHSRRWFHLQSRVSRDGHNRKSQRSRTFRSSTTTLKMTVTLRAVRVLQLGIRQGKAYSAYLTEARMIPTERRISHCIYEGGPMIT